MFRRANKITSLLVAAAAVVSLVPASAADVKKIDSEDGTIYNAVAYADGKAFVDGEINDDEAAYYVDGGDFTELDDVDSGDDADLFGEKYLNIDDGDYTVDLDAGTVTDDDIVGDTADDAAAALRKEIKDDTDDRYNEDVADDIKEEDDLYLIPGAKYGAVWYSTTYTQTTGGTSNGSASAFNVYTDVDGNYIDADYNLGKVKVTTTTSAVTKTSTIENSGDTYDAAGSNGSDALSASVSQDKVLTQDADNIYRLATVTVKTTTASGAIIKEINGVAVSASVFTVSDSGRTVTFKAIQKISKAAASGDVDGANYAKTVTTYALSDDDGSDLSNEDLILDADTQFTVAGGKLIAYNTVDDQESVVVNAYTLKSSSGFYYADEEDESKEDCKYNSTDGNGAAVQTDVDGNLWRLDGGYIYKFDNTDDWDKVYKVDGSLDELSVYDSDNMIAWSEDDEVYSLISGSSDTDTETPAVTTGWVQAADGTWSYVNEDGTKATSWLQSGSNWYYLNANGTMTTGWQNIGGTWYYLNPISDGTRGAMKTGWQNVSGTWYYLNPISDGTKGAMKTGWINDNGTWYYCNSSGAMLANTTVDGYVLGSNGAWIK